MEYDVGTPRCPPRFGALGPVGAPKADAGSGTCGITGEGNCTGFSAGAGDVEAIGRDMFGGSGMRAPAGGIVGKFGFRLPDCGRGEVGSDVIAGGTGMGAGTLAKGELLFTGARVLGSNGVRRGFGLVFTGAALPMRSGAELGLAPGCGKLGGGIGLPVELAGVGVPPGSLPFAA